MRTRTSFIKKIQFISIGSAMADMALLLLIFFMASTSSEPPQGVSVDIPRGYTESADQDSFYLTVSKNGELYLDGQKMTKEELVSELTMRQGERDRTVSITADREMPYKEIKELLYLLQKEDFLNVVFMAEPSQGEGQL